jgi:hypothetical protein
MAYQLNKDTKILLALLAIVVLCSAKLFKDYLYRNRYVEGLTLVSQQSSVQLRRPASGSITSNITFTVKLAKELTTAQTLSIGWTAVPNGVALPTTAANYKATASGYTIASPSSTVSASPATFGAPDKIIPSGTNIEIDVSGVTIAANSAINDPENLTFTITAGGDAAAITQTIKILPFVSTGQTAGASTYTASTGSTVAEIQEAIKGINDRLDALKILPSTSATISETSNLIKVRTAMISLLASTYGTIKEAGQVFESGALYEAQKTAIEFIKNEKARASSNAAALSGDNLNKRRMAQINTYYTRNYEANTDVMKNVIYVSVALIILAVLRKKELIPGSISTLGVIFILTMGGIVIGGQVFDIMRRNDSDFDKYDWNFNEDQMNKQKLIQSESSLSDLGIGGAPCYGASCCNVGTVWDAGSSTCLPGARITGSASWASSTLTVKLTTGVNLVSGDIITVNLPPGLFSKAVSGTDAAAAGTSLTHTAPKTDDKYILTVGSSGIIAGSITITITGLALNDAAKFSSTKIVTAFTSKESTPSTLGAISGVM